MTQAEFVANYWPWIIGTLGVLNPCFMLPQLYKIWSSRKADDVSLAMLGLLMLIQYAFSLHGYFIGDNLLLMSNLAAGTVTVITALSVLHFAKRTAST